MLINVTIKQTNRLLIANHINMKNIIVPITKGGYLHLVVNYNNKNKKKNIHWDDSNEIVKHLLL